MLYELGVADDIVTQLFDRLVKSIRQSGARLMLTERHEKKQWYGPAALKTGSQQIPGGKGTGGPMPRKGEDARPGPMVRGGAVSRVGQASFLTK